MDIVDIFAFFGWNNKNLSRKYERNTQLKFTRSYKKNVWQSYIFKIKLKTLYDNIWEGSINNTFPNFVFTVHPCDQISKGGCGDTCTKNGDLTKCSCSKTGFKLHSDGKTCGRRVFGLSACSRKET